MRLLAAAVIVVSACAGAPRDQVRGYGYGAEPVRCFDQACRMVESHLSDLRADRVTFFQCASRVLRIGERAVPTLRRELDSESLLHVRMSAYVLTALGHGDEVVAWCRGAGRAGDGRDLACSSE